MKQYIIPMADEVTLHIEQPLAASLRDTSSGNPLKDLTTGEEDFGGDFDARPRAHNDWVEDWD